MIDTQLWGELISQLTNDPRNWNSYDEPNRAIVTQIYKVLDDIDLDGVSAWEAAQAHAVYLLGKAENYPATSLPASKRRAKKDDEWIARRIKQQGR